MMTDYELSNGTVDCADASVEHCPFCGSDDFFYKGNGTYHCDYCNEDFERNDCDFCENCGEQVPFVATENITDEDGTIFCSEKCLNEYYNNI